MLLFRTATRQICRRMGYFATFMARPALKGYYASGWHLHQSLVERRKRANCSCRKSGSEDCCRRSAAAFLGGLLHYAVPRPSSRRRPSTAIAASAQTRSRRTAPPGPTTTAAPCSACWAAPGDPATRIENRIGEPAANPYLFIMSQIVAGLAGIDAETRSRGLPTTSPMPPSARCCRRAWRRRSMRWRRSRCSAPQLGDIFVDYFVKLKRTEVGRYQRRCEESGVGGQRRTERMGAE